MESTSKISVLVHLHTILQTETSDGLVDRLEISLDGGSTISDILKKLDIQLHPDTLLLVINGRMSDLNQQLQDGDVVNLMPAISGGFIGNLNE